MSDELAYKILDTIEKHHVQYMSIFARQDKRFEEQDKRFAAQDKRFASHDKRLDEHTKLLKEHSADIKSIKRSLVLIEDAVMNKIPALFDAFMVSQQKDAEMSNNIKKLEKIANFHSLKISILEDTSKKHSERLAKLSS